MQEIAGMIYTSLILLEWAISEQIFMWMKVVRYQGFQLQEICLSLEQWSPTLHFKRDKHYKRHRSLQVQVTYTDHVETPLGRGTDILSDLSTLLLCLLDSII